MKNKFYLRNSYVIILFKNKPILIDLDDFEKIKNHSWCISKTGYAVSNINGKVIKLHRFILNAKENQIIDHINRNKLDNRKSNLRFCSNHQNCMNCNNTKSNKLPIGISIRDYGSYRARIMINRKEICLGYFKTIKEAIIARKKAEKKYFNGFKFEND